MKMLIVFFLFTQFLTVSSHAQIKYNFDSVFAQIIKPPANCEDASKLFPLDSASGKVIAGTEFSELETELNKIQSEINLTLSNYKKQMKDMPKPPPGAGPPGGIPEINPDDFSDMKEINDIRAKAFENIAISMNQFKNEILGNQEELNKNLKKTRLPEKDKRLKYVNEFLEISKAENNKCFSVVLKNVTELEGTFKDEKSFGNEKNKFPNIGKLKYESELIDTVMLFYNISKQLSEAGSMFYYGIR